MYCDLPQYRSLVEAIRDHPDDDVLRLALSDLIESEASDAADLPRAEFIRLQVRRAGLALADPDRQRLQQREQELLARYGAAWSRELPDLAGVRWGPFERGFVTSAVLATVHPLRDLAEPLFTATPLVRVRILSLRSELELVELALCPTLAEVRELELTELDRNWSLRDLLSSPYLAQVQGLFLTRLQLDDTDALILARTDLPTLQSLSLAGNPIGSAGVWYLGQASWLGQLRRLDLSDCGDAFVGSFPGLDVLEELSLAGNRCSRHVLEAFLADEHLPALRKLDCRRCGLAINEVQLLLASALGQRVELLLDDNIGADLLREVVRANTSPQVGVIDLSNQNLGVEGVRTALSQPRLSQPTELRLQNAQLGPAELEALLESPRLRDIERLDLSFNPFNGPVAAELIASADLPGLRRLDLTSCGLPVSAIRRLRTSPRMQQLDELLLWGNPGLGLLDTLTTALTTDPTTWNLVSNAGDLDAGEFTRLLDWPALVGVRSLILPWELTVPEVLVSLEECRLVCTSKGEHGLLLLDSLTWHGLPADRSTTIDRLAQWLASPLMSRLRELRLVVDADDLNFPAIVQDLLAARFDRLEVLALERLGLTPDALRTLAFWPVLPRLRALSLVEPEAGIVGLAALLRADRLPALESLSLRMFSDMPGAALVDLLLASGLLPRLKTLRLLGPGLHSSDVRRLTESGQLRSLTSLALVNHAELGEGTARALASCADLVNLQRLDLDGTAIGDAGFRWLASSPHLTSLATLRLADPASRLLIRALETLAGDHPSLAGTTGLPALRELYLAGNALTNAGVEALAASPRLATLTHLDLSGQQALASNESLGNRAALALVASPYTTGSVNLANNAIRYGGCRAVRTSPLAARVNLTGNIGLDQENAVAELLADPEQRHPIDGLLDSCLPCLLDRDGLERVRELDLSHGRLTIAGLRLLAAAPRLTNLRRLLLTHQDPPLPEDALRVLLAGEAFPHLESLSLFGNAITTPGLPLDALAAHPTLTALDLDTNRIDREGVRALLNHPRLRGQLWVDLRNNAGWGIEQANWQARAAGTPAVLELEGAAGLVNELLRHLRERSVPLQELTFSRQTLTPAERRRLLNAPELAGLRKLGLAGSDLDRMGVIALAECRNLPQLTRLDLSGNPLDDGEVSEAEKAGHAPLGVAVNRLLESEHFPALEELRLDGLFPRQWPGDSDAPSAASTVLFRLAACRPRVPLRRLSLVSNRLCNQWSHLVWDDLGLLLRWPGMERLTALDLSDNPGLFGDSILRLASQGYPVTRLAELTSLRLNDLPQLRAPGLRAILGGGRGGSPHEVTDGPVRLRELSLRNTHPGTIGIRLLAASRRLRELRELYLGLNALRERELSLLFESDTLQRLEVLDLSDNPVREADLERLTRARFASRLRVLRLGATELQDLTGLWPRLAEALPRLEELDIGQCRLNAGSITALASSPLLGRLRRLRLAGISIESRHLAPLLASSRLSQLEQLDAQFLWLGPDELAILARNPHLQRLSHLLIQHNYIGDAGAAALAEAVALHRVRSLWLTPHEVTDRTLARLAARYGLALTLA
jgi:uncharacterized protein (TIGR02996 family)